MEEDIVLLNDFIKGNFQKDKLENYKGSYKMGFFYYKDIQEAIENLLKRYKDLEEENKHKVSQIDFLSKEYDIMFDTINNLDFYIDDLIKECKEGIERLDGDDCDTEIRFETEIETLQRIKDKLSNDEWQYKVSIPISVIQNILDELDKKIPIAQGEELLIFEAKEDVLQEILKRKE